MDLSSEGVAFFRTSAHNGLLGLPIDLGAMLLQPCKPKDEILLAEVGDSKVGLLSVPIHV